MSFLVLLALLVAVAVSLPGYLQDKALHALPYGFKKFSLDDLLPDCARSKGLGIDSTYQLFLLARMAEELVKYYFTDLLANARTCCLTFGDWGQTPAFSPLGVIKRNKPPSGGLLRLEVAT